MLYIHVFLELYKYNFPFSESYMHNFLWSYSFLCIPYLSRNCWIFRCIYTRAFFYIPWLGFEFRSLQLSSFCSPAPLRDQNCAPRMTGSPSAGRHIGMNPQLLWPWTLSISKSTQPAAWAASVYFNSHRQRKNNLLKVTYCNTFLHYQSGSLSAVAKPTYIYTKHRVASRKHI